MTAKKMTPRQKMINMMYLVLTALLAMNVSKEVLNAFIIVDDSMVQSNYQKMFENEDLYKMIAQYYYENEDENNDKIYQLSLQTQSITKQAIQEIEQLQNELKDLSGRDKEDNNQFLAPDDINAGTRLLTDEGNGLSKGESLRLRLSEIRNDYLDVIALGNITIEGSNQYKNYKAEYEKTLALNDLPEEIEGVGKEKKKWAIFNFYNVPVVASDVILEKLKSDVIQTENQVLQYLQKQMKGDIIEFDELQASVIAPKSYLAAGSTYEADIFISAGSSNTQTEVFIGKIDKSLFGEQKMLTSNENTLPFIGDYKQLTVENGRAKYEANTGGAGSITYEGIIRVLKPNGSYELYPFEGEYEIAPPSGFSISPTKMNVLYMGVDNPLDIAVSGAKSDADINVSIDNGTISKKGNGKYIVNVTNAGSAKVKVNAIVNDQNESFAPMEFRVLPIPDPSISLCGFEITNAMSKAKLEACSGLIAQSPEFVFDVRFEVISFEFKRKQKNGNFLSVTNNGPLFNGQIINLIEQLEAKDAVVIDKIIVKDPANKKRKINGSIYIEII